MSDKTTIEWTDATWTPIRARSIELQNDGSGRERIGWHCEHASDGCRNCYAERINRRLGTGRPFKPAELKHTTRLGDARGSVDLYLDDRMLGQPQRWRKARDVFVCSMTDLFAAFVPDEWIDAVFALMSEAPWHRYQVLTKRANRMRQYMTAPDRVARIRRAAEALAERDAIRLLDDPVGAWPLPHVIMMISAETQREANERIPELLATPAACRGVSLEPLLGRIDLRELVTRSDRILTEAVDALLGKIMCVNDHGSGRIDGCARLDWVIAGGESGPHARPSHPDWFRSLRDQCAAAGVPFHFKQWGEWWEVDSDGRDDDTGDHRLIEVPGIVADEWFDPKTDRLVAPDGRVFAALDDLPEDTRCRHMTRLGKKAAGRRLDGTEHNGFPA
jgi:protein gp37